MWRVMGIYSRLRMEKNMETAMYCLGFRVRRT